MINLSSFERRTAILDYVRAHERASTRQLSEIFRVSEVTIRSDLSLLEGSGLLERKHGGAEFARALQAEQPFDVRRGTHLVEKAAIAQAAASLIEPGHYIMLDASTTAYQLAWQIKDRRDLTIITNSLQAGLLLFNNAALEVVLIGGQLRGGVGSVVGLLAEEMLAKLHAQRGFFGAAGFTIERGLTDADLREVQIKRSMIAAVDEVVVLMDSSKFGQHALLTFAGLADIDHLITDNGIPPEYVQTCGQSDIQLTII